MLQTHVEGSAVHGRMYEGLAVMVSPKPLR